MRAEPCRTPAPEGPRIVGVYKAVFTDPPGRIPSDCAIDAPLMGNGDLLAALAGGPDKPQFFINKNDLWVTNKTGGSRPLPLARLNLNLPGLAGASYRVEQDLLRGITTETCAKGGATLTMETAVSATQNLLWVKLSARGGVFAGEAALSLPMARGLGGPLTGGTGRIQLGREQYGVGRWYFDGAMDKVAIYDRALPEAAIRKLAAGETVREGLLRDWDFATTGTVPGPKGGKAMVFDGSTTFVDSPPLKPGHGLTFAAFVKVNHHTGGGNAQYLVSQGEWNKDWAVGLSDGKLRLTLNGECAESPEALPLGKWVHVCGTYDGKILRVFVDGRDQNPAPAAQAGVQAVERRFDKGMLFPTAAACAMRVVSGDATDGGAFTVSPGKDVLIVAAAASLLESKDFRAMAETRAAQFKATDLTAIHTAHEAWWRHFWDRSFIEIPDKTLEQRYRLSHYAMACASRLADFPPDLYGWETTDSPKWGGGYFLNYNFYAPFYGLYAGNHIEQADPCIGAILDATELGKLYSKGPEAGIEGGILLPVSIGAKGSVSCAATWHQKSDSSYCCVPIASRWYATYDLAFARKAYPFVRDVAYFWEKWLKFENGRYVDRNDATQEICSWDSNPCGEDNPIHTLALIRQVMGLAIDMSAELGVDADRRAKWADIRDRMSDYPTCTVGDLPLRAAASTSLAPKKCSTCRSSATAKQEVRLGRTATPWVSSTSSPATASASTASRSCWPARATRCACSIAGSTSTAATAFIPPPCGWAMIRWTSSSTCAIGWRPRPPTACGATIRTWMEQFSVVSCTLQEMLLQSYDGTLRLFPCWPGDQDARFGTLRARGAFLVSAELESRGRIGGVKIMSEKGRDCTWSIRGRAGRWR